MRRISHSGFTLIELSIVLVIIGLLVGGVLTGRDLIKAAELRKFGNDLQAFRAGFATFRLKYDEIPGDMPNPASLGLAGVGGNGDGMINNWNAETVYAWMMLDSSNLTPRLKNEGTTCKMNFNNADTYFYHRDLYGDSLVTKNANALTITAWNASWLLGPSINTQDALWVDQKFDDGKPASGSLLGLTAYDHSPAPIPNCTSSGNYTIDGNNSLRCRLIYYVE